MKLLLAQINTTVLDFPGNFNKIALSVQHARELGADVVVTPELALTGYPPLDLLERTEVLTEALGYLDQLAALSADLTLVVGMALPASFQATPAELPLPHLSGTQRPAINAAVVFDHGRLLGCVRKRLLPTYDVFDEERYFQPGQQAQVFDLAGRRLGVTVCEDIWSLDDQGAPRYPLDPIGELVAAGADCIINLSASPFELGKALRRLHLVSGHAAHWGVPIAYCNLVGGNDSLVFDGRSFAMDAAGQLLTSGPSYQAADLIVDFSAATSPDPLWCPQGQPLAAPHDFDLPPAQDVRAALVLGLRDYVHKCGFSRVLLGLSGGIDSAVTAALAVEALGSESVLGVALPGPYSSPASVTDALELAANLQIRCPIMPIDGPMAATQLTLSDEFARMPGQPHDIAEQNIQARLRGLLLMALSNRSGAMLLTTGNKSEIAVGYCTLYGDMNGGLAVIGDVPKTLVYDVAAVINQDRVIIPLSTIIKPPSAELAPDQTDQDSLPPYPVLDAILALHLLDQRPVADICAQTGFARDVVQRVVRMVELAEYKRRQAAPVLRVTRKAFGVGRRVPMARAMPQVLAVSPSVEP